MDRPHWRFSFQSCEWQAGHHAVQTRSVQPAHRGADDAPCQICPRGHDQQDCAQGGAGGHESGPPEPASALHQQHCPPCERERRRRGGQGHAQCPRPGVLAGGGRAGLGERGDRHGRSGGRRGDCHPSRHAGHRERQRGAPLCRADVAHRNGTQSHRRFLRGGALVGGRLHIHDDDAFGRGELPVRAFAVSDQRCDRVRAAVQWQGRIVWRPYTTLRFACMVLLALRACRLSEAGRGREMLCRSSGFACGEMEMCHTEITEITEIIRYAHFFRSHRSHSFLGGDDDFHLERICSVFCGW